MITILLMMPSPAFAGRFVGRFFSCWHLLFAFVFSLGLLAASPQAAAFSGSGSGIAVDPYLITSAAQLDEVRDALGASYKLANDVDLSAYLALGGAGFAKWGSEGWEPIGSDTAAFTGNFDGAGHKITGLWIDRSTENYVGLFGFVENATIANLGVEIAAAGVTGQYQVGGLVGVLLSSGGSITNSYVTGDVSGGANVGGLVGYQNNGSIANSYATGNVSIGGPISHAVGGLVGGSGGSIANSYATGNVSSGGVSYSSAVGGLVGAGYQGGSITNSYATGSVSGTDQVGGLVGNSNGSIANSFFDMQTTGQDNGVGAGSSAGVTGKTTAEMKTQTTFTAAGWDFSGASPVWLMPPGSYPLLAWQMATYNLNFAAGGNSAAANGVTATGAISPSGPQAAGETIIVTITLTGTAAAAGALTVKLSSATLGAGAPASQSMTVTAGQPMGAVSPMTFTFTMPASNVNDLVAGLTFTPLSSASPTAVPTLGEWALGLLALMLAGTVALWRRV